MDEDIIDTWRAMAEMSKEKRANNRAFSANLLVTSGHKYESKNDGAHLIVDCPTGRIDYWPGTGAWIQRHTLTRGRGVKNLLQFIKDQAGIAQR